METKCADMFVGSGTIDVANSGSGSGSAANSVFDSNWGPEFMSIIAIRLNGSNFYPMGQIC